MPEQDERRARQQLPRADAGLPAQMEGTGTERTSRDALAPWLVILGALLAAASAAFLLLPSRRLTSEKAIEQALLWMLVTLLAGTGAMELSRRMRTRSSRPFHIDALEAAAAWLLLPPLLILAVHGSAWTAPIAAGIAGILALCLRGMVPLPLPLPDEQILPGPEFAELPAPDSGRPQALAIAICLEAAAVLAMRRELLPETLLSALASFLFVWKALTMLLRARSESIARPATRSAAAAVLALLVIVPFSLLQLIRMGPNVGAANSARQNAPKQRKGTPAREEAGDAYRGIILFTVPKKEILMPPAAQNSLRANGIRKPLIIPFDGAYWYFQTPQHGPGLHPHLAHGDPVKVSIYSTGWIPLAMQAHQALPQPVDLRSCGAMQVTIKNGDNRPGRIDIGLLLTDKSLPGKPSVFLGAKPIASTEPGNFTIKVEPVRENVSFPIPAHVSLHRFDDITVFFFPVPQRATLGTRVAIEQFTIEPR